MNVVRRLQPHPLPPSRNPTTPPPADSVRKAPVALTPIAWGTRDKALARVLCRHVADLPTNHRTFRPFPFV